MKALRAAIALLFGSALVSGPAAQSAPVATPDAAIDRAAADYLSDDCRVGLSIVAYVDGTMSFHNYGSIRRGRLQRPTPDSVYELASVTKTFIGALAARALVEGRMTLDGDFRTHLPGAYPNLIAGGRPITLRTLATHTSGLQRDLPDSDALLANPDFDRIGDQLIALNRGFTRDRSLEGLREVALRSTPGAIFAYSNLGIRVIGYGLEGAYARPLDRLLRQSILSPLGMGDTRFTLSPSMRERLVVPYSRFRHVQPYHDASAGAAYGLYSTPRDMARYLAWQFDARSPVVARAHTRIRGTADEGEALIWNVGRDGDTPLLWHGGGSFGMTSQMVLFPGDRQGFVLLANDACAGSEGALKQIALSVHRAWGRPR